VKASISQVDSFSGKVFAGNPAAVYLFVQWPSDATLIKISSENNLSETAFLVASKEGFDIRWFTPIDEVDLCGHATFKIF
jgi:PhzF family phenazine biosynthesis protein